MSQIETDYKNQIINQTAYDFQNLLLDNGKNGILTVLQMVYGIQQFSEEEIQSMQDYIKKNKYDNQSNVITKLTNVLNETQLQKYDGEYELRSFFKKYDDSGEQKAEDQELKKDKLKQEKIVFSDPIKKSRISNVKKSIYSQQVDKLIEEMKKIFWGIDMERIGSITQKADIEDFLSSLKEEFDKLNMFMSHVEIYDTICNNLAIKKIEKIEIDQVEKIIVHFISNQTIIPLYKI